MPSQARSSFITIEGEYNNLMNTPKLNNREAFEAALSNYQLSPEAQATLDETPFVLMLAPSAAGRNTIIKELLKTGHYYFIISDTTRPPRINDGVPEQSGVEYFFRTEDEMLDDITHGRFIEAEIIHKQQVSGTSIRELEKAHQQQKIAITDVDLGGALNIMQLKQDVTPIFIVPPTFDEWLRRLTERSTTTEQEVRRRVETAVTIFQTVLDNQKFICVLNDNLAHAVADVDHIAMTKQINQPLQAEMRQLVAQLLKDAQNYLAQ